VSVRRSRAVSLRIKPTDAASTPSAITMPTAVPMPAIAPKSARREIRPAGGEFERGLVRENDVPRGSERLRGSSGGIHVAVRHPQPRRSPQGCEAPGRARSWPNRIWA
jgi:hypothetical protein